MISLSHNKFMFLLGNYQQISYRIIQFLEPEESLELSLACQALQSTVNGVVEKNIKELQALWFKSPSDSSASSGEEEEAKKDAEVVSKKKNKSNKKNNNPEKQKSKKWVKKNIFELDECLKQDLVNFKNFTKVNTEKLDPEIQEKFFRGNLNAFFLKESTNELIVINRTLVDQGLNFEMIETDDSESKYGELFNSESFSNANFDFSNQKALIERQKQILESLNKTEQQKLQQKLNMKPKIEEILNFKKITVILCHGGYFSLGIFNKKKSIFHKSDHKYVVRKKAGKRQISRDSNAGSNIKSMGSQIRRDQEKKHQENINAILTESYKQIKDSDIILYHAPGFNRYLILDVGSPLWDLRDKFRSICLTPKRANYTEVERIYEYLTKFYIMSLKQ